MPDDERYAGLIARWSMDEIPGLKIRHMTDNDMAAIVEIDQKIVGSERSWRQRASSHFRTYHAPLSFVAGVAGKVVGFLMGDLRGAEYGLPLSGYLDIMGTDPQWQGKGIGRRLLETFVRECHDMRVKARAVIREGEKRNQMFLLSAGFERGDLVEYVKGFD